MARDLGIGDQHGCVHAERRPASRASSRGAL
jgi:hypothetical protein